MDFPLGGLLDPRACYDFLVRQIHPEGLACPRCRCAELRVQRRTRDPVLDYRCPRCRRIFNAFTGTAFQKTSYPPATLVLILHGVAQGTPTAKLARELGISPRNLLNLRHRLQANALARRDAGPLPDAQVEADEMYQDAGRKGEKHADPPRRRANSRRGRVGWDGDRPPVCGVVGRASRRVRLRVERRADAITLEKVVLPATGPGTSVWTDECAGYNGLPRRGRPHASVRHSAREWARDDDGDGVREVHCNTMEGIWTGLRTFLRRFRGVHKGYLSQYVAIFEWCHNLKEATPGFIRALLDKRCSTTPCP